MVTTIPVTWDIDAVAKLDFKKDHHKDSGMIDLYRKSGHDASRMIIYNYWEPNPMPTGITEIKNYFSKLTCVALAVHKTPAGCYLPLHHDLYERYREIFKISQRRSIVRAIVMLAASVPGQIIQIDRDTYGEWHSGQVFSWHDQVLHAVYNFSMQDRFAVQITGVMI